MKTYLMLSVLLLSSCAPVTLRQWKPDEGLVTLTVVLANWQSRPDQDQAQRAASMASERCRTGVSLQEEGSFLTGNTTRAGHVTETAPNNPFGPGASGFSSTVQERGYYWTFRCKEAR